MRADEQNREDVAQKRTEWKKAQPLWDAGSLVFLDESGAKTNMTRLRGRSPGGTRCHDSAPGGSWTTITMISSMRLSGATECMVMPGATNSISFREYVRHFLAPSLKQGDTVVMDNLAAHKDRESMELIEARGARVKFLPPYSPDLNPIEMMWSKVKEFLRNAKARTTDELVHAIKEALGSVTVENIAGWVNKSGYVIM